MNETNVFDILFSFCAVVSSASVWHSSLLRILVGVHSLYLFYDSKNRISLLCPQSVTMLSIKFINIPVN